MSAILGLDLNNELNLDISKENKNIITEVSDAYEKAVENGIDKLDLTDEYKGIVKTEIKKEEFKTAGMQVIEAVLRIGAKAIGVNTSAFNSVKQIIDALKAGDLKRCLSGALDVGIDLIKGIPADAKKLIKSSKNVFLGNNLDSELKKVMTKQKNTIDRLDKKCDKFDDAFNRNDSNGMAKQIKSIKNDLDKVMLIENTINRARSTVNKYELMMNKPSNELTELEKEICKKI